MLSSSYFLGHTSQSASFIMSLKEIKAVDITLGELFKDFYLVPDYQREYVWEIKQVDQLLDDVFPAFEDYLEDNSTDYFIGSIILCPSKHGKNTYALIDGQQRLTTIYLLFCAIRYTLSKISEKENKKSIDFIENQILKSQNFVGNKPIDQYKLELQYKESQEILKKIEEIQDPEQLSKENFSTGSNQRILEAYKTLCNRIEEESDYSSDKLNQLLGYLKDQVTVIRIETANILYALKVFETVNNRGVDLNSMDLLKNLMFMKVSSSEQETLKNMWKSMLDTLNKGGVKKTISFLRHIIMSRYSVVPIKEDSLYEWFRESENLKRSGCENSAIDFIYGLLDDANFYTNLNQGLDLQSKPLYPLKNIIHTSKSASQHLILLLAGKELDINCLNLLCESIEELLFVYRVSGTDKNKLEPLFVKLASKLREKSIKYKNNPTLFKEDFIEPLITEEKRKLIDRFNLGFSQLAFEGKVRRGNEYKFIKYILAKITQYIEILAWGATEDRKNLETYTNSTIEVEHIQAIQNQSNNHSFQLKDLQNIGNLTLLEKSINASAGNNDFSEKIKLYPHSNFLLTQSIVKIPKIGNNTAPNRAVSNLKSFSIWTTESIKERQNILLELSYKIWNIK